MVLGVVKARPDEVNARLPTNVAQEKSQSMEKKNTKRPIITVPRDFSVPV
jgi:hypothetical protein